MRFRELFGRHVHRRAVLDGIPVVWVEPQRAMRRELVVWLTGFSGSAEAMVPKLAELADDGFVALSFDPPSHGRRRVRSKRRLWDETFANFRRNMWPIIGQATLESLRVIDWAVAELNVSPRVRFGGISMGGDVALAAAGIDRRIISVAATVATPEWTRPGSDVCHGSADAYAQWLYDQLNPMSHVDRYSHAPAISLQLGRADVHVPPEPAREFGRRIAPYYAAAPQRLEIVEHAVGHESTDAMWKNCRAWFGRPA